MADTEKTEAQEQEGVPVAWVTFSDGKEVEVDVEGVSNMFWSDTFHLPEGATKITPMASSFIRVDVDLSAIEVDGFTFDDGWRLPLGHLGAELRTDVPFFFNLEDSINDPSKTALIACQDDAIIFEDQDSWQLFRVLVDGSDGLVTEDTETGMFATSSDGTRKAMTFKDFGFDPSSAYAFRHAPGDDLKVFPFHETEADGTFFITLGDLMGGLGVMYSSLLLAAQIHEKMLQKSADGTQTVPLAQYSKTFSFQNHDFASKAIDGLFSIAMGESKYEIAPRKTARNERYALTASPDACAELFQVRGANTEQVRAILDTVQSLKEDPRAADFLHEGRVWFTVNKIVEETLRTSSGTISGKDNRTAQELVDSALKAASGAQIVGTSEDGSPTNVLYLLDAVRLDTVEYNGETYHDVWGISVSTRTYQDYAKERGRYYKYGLPESSRPFTLDTVAAHNYVSDIMRELRGKLYYTIQRGKRKGQIVARKKPDTFTVTRSWDAIFDLMSPTRKLDSRQKDRVVKAFEEALTDLVREEAHGRHEGAPIYVRAWSERDGGKGRGKGAWRNLCVEATRNFRPVRDGEAQHGGIDLHIGVEGAAPSNKKSS